MAEERQQPPTRQHPPQKSIPPARDRLQARLLTGLFAALTLACIAFGLLATGDEGGRYQVAGASLSLAILAWLLRSATLGGAIAGVLACFSLTWWTRDLESPLPHSALPPLIALFVLTFLATRAGKKQKLARGLAERTGGRNAAQVFANVGIAALVVTPIGAYAAALTGLNLPIDALVLGAAALAALAEATADTVSSEIGQAFGTRTFLITNLRRVHRGTDGAVSAQGTLAGLAAALLVVLVGTWALRLPFAASALALAAGCVSFFADSLLGATLERRGWIGNDVVNLLSTTIAAASALAFTRIAASIHG